MLPAVLVGLLLLLAMLQFSLAGSVSLPPQGEAIGRIAARYAAPHVAIVVVPQVIMDQPIFSPSRTMGGGAAQEADPLQGAVVAGAISVHGRSRVLLRRPDGLPISIAPGGKYGGWQLVGETHEGARFRRDRETIVIPYGASAPPAAVQTSEDQEEEQ